MNYLISYSKKKKDWQNEKTKTFFFSNSKMCDSLLTLKRNTINKRKHACSALSR